MIVSLKQNKLLPKKYYIHETKGPYYQWSSYHLWLHLSHKSILGYVFLYLTNISRHLCLIRLAMTLFSAEQSQPFPVHNCTSFLGHHNLKIIKICQLFFIDFHCNTSEIKILGNPATIKYRVSWTQVLWTPTQNYCPFSLSSFSKVAGYRANYFQGIAQFYFQGMAMSFR